MLSSPESRAKKCKLTCCVSLGAQLACHCSLSADCGGLGQLVEKGGVKKQQTHWILRLSSKSQPMGQRISALVTRNVARRLASCVEAHTPPHPTPPLPLGLQRAQFKPPVHTFGQVSVPSAWPSFLSLGALFSCPQAPGRTWALACPPGSLVTHTALEFHSLAWAHLYTGGEQQES